MDIYDKIYDFCKIKNHGGIRKNTNNPTPRVNYLMILLKRMNIPFELDKFESRGYIAYNIVMKGSSSKMVVAHHDIVNLYSDNANDNSASVINAIMVKKLNPSINVVLLDGEEVGGIGSQRVSEQINAGEFGNIEWVLNLELTGKGGKYFFIGNYPGKLFDHIKSLFPCPVYNTIYNDSVTFRKNGIDSVVINPCPLTDEENDMEFNGKYLDTSLLWNCHSLRDSVSTIDPKDMKEFVEEVVLKILE